MEMMENALLRIAAVIAVMAVGSCEAPTIDEHIAFADGAANHPITVEPSYQSLKLAYSGDLSPDDANRFAVFVQDYLEHGNGAITISAPGGPGSAHAITYFGEQLAALGVPRARILVGTHDAVGPDERVEIGYVSYAAHTDQCGNWTVNASETVENTPLPNFGCSVQHNIAAAVADPRDLVTPRPMGPADANRREAVLGKYEQGQPTAAQQTQKQSGAVSDVTTGGSQ
jgi:pilus assembly protein CpaD